MLGPPHPAPLGAGVCARQGCRLSPGGRLPRPSQPAARPSPPACRLCEPPGGEPGGRFGPRGASAIERVTSPAARGQRGAQSPGRRPSPALAGRCQDPASPGRQAAAGLKGLRPRAWAPAPGLASRCARRPRPIPEARGTAAGGRACVSSSFRLLLCSEFPAPLPPPAPQPGPSPSLPFFLPRLPAAKEAHLL